MAVPPIVAIGGTESVLGWPKPDPLRAGGSDLQGLRLVGGPRALVGGDVVLVPERDGDVVQAVQQPPAGVLVQLEGGGDALGPHLTRLKVHSDLGSRVLL